jgi:hypothetical protein
MIPLTSTPCVEKKTLVSDLLVAAACSGLGLLRILVLSFFLLCFFFPQIVLPHLSPRWFGVIQYCNLPLYVDNLSGLLCVSDVFGYVCQG